MSLPSLSCYYSSSLGGQKNGIHACRRQWLVRVLAKIMPIDCKIWSNNKLFYNEEMIKTKWGWQLHYRRQKARVEAWRVLLTLLITLLHILHSKFCGSTRLIIRILQATGIHTSSKVFEHSQLGTFDVKHLAQLRVSLFCSAHWRKAIMYTVSRLICWMESRRL